MQKPVLYANNVRYVMIFIPQANIVSEGLMNIFRQNM